MSNYQPGQRCPHDGGACHHWCDAKCWRKEFCGPRFGQWPGYPVPGDAPVRKSVTPVTDSTVTRIERDVRPGYPAADATFLECGHMYRFAAGLGPPVGAKRYCYACSQTVTPVTDSTVKTG